MLPIIGLVVVFASVIVGYTSHHGRLDVLWQPTEFLIIGGAGLGSFLIANPPSVLKGTLHGLLGLLKPNPFSRKAFSELLQVMFEIFQTART